MLEKRHLIGPLAHWLAAGKLDAQSVLPAIEQLSADDPKSLPEILGALEGEADGVWATLAEALRLTLHKDALRIYQAKQAGIALRDEESLSGLPLVAVDPWLADANVTAALSDALRIACELRFLADKQEQMPGLFACVQREGMQVLHSASKQVEALIERLPQPWIQRLAAAWASNLPGRERVLSELDNWRDAYQKNWHQQAARVIKNPPSELELLPAVMAARFAAAEQRGERERLLDTACCWMSPAIVPALTAMTQDAWAKDRAMWNLTLRFGQPQLAVWGDWQVWLDEQARQWQAAELALDSLIDQHAAVLLLVMYFRTPDQDPAVLDDLLESVAKDEPPVEPAILVAEWSKWIPLAERRLLLGDSPSLPPPLPGSGNPAAATTGVHLPVRPPFQRSAAPPVVTVVPSVDVVLPPAPPRPPTAWEVHVQPFLMENWYIVAGIAMVLLGCSLLAYYTWDKHWLVRYTLMPLLLGGFTWSLAGVGAWIETKSAEFKGTGAILRAAAIGLLPINFMAIALLSADDSVQHKVPAVVGMALIYLLVFGWGLRKWCAAIDATLGTLLAGTLLLLNSLVAVAPLARSLGHPDSDALRLCLGSGFYLGFAATAGLLVYFTRKILTREMADDKRVPWFVAGVLAMTFLEVFVWVHGFMRHLPQAPTYALMVILTGWLVLHGERRALQLKASPQLHGGESFLGFAMILLGLLMGFGDPLLRIVAFVTAGAVWMYQGLRRRHPLHDWIALTLMGLGGGAVGLYPGYPAAMLPLLGLLLAGGFGGSAWLGRRIVMKRSASEDAASEVVLPTWIEACWGMQMVALVLTALLAPLVQWHEGCAPLGTAGWLALAAVAVGWRALRDQQLPWLHTSLAILALALPFAGFMDVAGRSAHHQSMVLGLALLSWLWLGVTWIGRDPLLRQARTTVLWLYGALALAAMALRVLLGDNAPAVQWYCAWMEAAGPPLMMLVLIPATYVSRSLVPAGMAVAIMAILFPELKANLQLSAPGLAWGSGLDSALSALALAGLCFRLRTWPALQDLPEGDRLLGNEMCPFQRRDSTLFTWPVMAAVVWLLVKIDTLTLISNLLETGILLKTALALAIAGVAWTVTAIYHRRERWAVVGVHLGWLNVLAGLGMGYWHASKAPHWAWPALVMGLLLQALYWLYRFGLEPSRPWVRELLTEPTRQVLLAGSAVLSVFLMLDLFSGGKMEWMLYGFLLAQLPWHGLRTRHELWGRLLFFQVWVGLLAVSVDGSGPLWLRVIAHHSLTPTLYLLGGIQVLLVGLELSKFWRRWDSGASAGTAGSPAFGYFAPLFTPVLELATGMAALLGLAGLAGLADGINALNLTGSDQVMLLAVLLLTARAQASSLLLLPALLLAYVMIQRGALLATGHLTGQLEILAMPWRLGVLGLGIVGVAQVGRCLQQCRPRCVAGAFAMPAFASEAYLWLCLPACGICGVAAFYHTADPTLRESAAQLWAPYLGTLTFALVAWCWKRVNFFAGAGLLLVLGNVHLARVSGGDFLRGHGLSELHLICLGLGLSLLQTSLLRRMIRPAAALAVINRASLWLAGVVLTLLAANYFTAPDLTTISATRFGVSGTLAWLAGWYFRRAARHPGPGEEGHGDLCEALYHLGLVVAFWCAALLVPAFRQPLAALVALCLPVVYFYGRAELGMHQDRPESRSYRNSAAVLGFVILGLYLFKAVFQVLLFPGTAIGFQHYHSNAPLIIIIGVVLLRLHGLGGTSWLALYGGLALMTGSYFLLGGLPGLSPFEQPMAGAWCALGLGHFWIVLSHARSPLRTVIQRLAGLDDAIWESLRRAWGLCLLAATHAATLWGVVNFSDNTQMVAPLLAGAATILIHQGLLRRSPLYLVASACELTVALHMDFFIPSYLPANGIIWVILGIWAALLATFECGPRKHTQPDVVGGISAVLAMMVLAHVFYQRPWSAAGLWGMGLAGLLAARVPVSVSITSGSRSLGAAIRAQASALLLLGVPVWLVYFSQARIAQCGLIATIEAWPVLTGTLTCFAIGAFGRLFPREWSPNKPERPRVRFRLLDLTLSWLETAGQQIHLATVWISSAAVAMLVMGHYAAAYAPRELVLLVMLEAALAGAWFNQGKERQSMVANWLMQLCVAACFASLRRQLMLTTEWWSYEYDVWASLAVSFGIAGAKQALGLQARTLRVPLLTTLCVLPLISLIWVLVHGLGVNLGLIVMGLHSVLFAYLGKDRRESPYNILALAGFVGFILLTFYSKLHIQALHAYIIPVGLGVLVLQELFKNRISPDARNWIRLLVLMAILGSSGYYAMADTSQPIAFNLTMIILCLAAMGLGSLLRIRLYLALGLAGLLADLASLLYKVLVLMERSARMTVVGGLVLLIGVIVVVGAIYFKTNRARIDALLKRWHLTLTAWQ